VQPAQQPASVSTSFVNSHGSLLKNDKQGAHHEIPIARKVGKTSP
jgi:hypothetical protein